MTRSDREESRAGGLRRGRLVLIVGLLVATSLVVLDWLVPTVRFSSVRLNFLALLAALLLPSVALILALSGTRGLARGALAIVLVPVAMVGLALSVTMFAVCPTCVTRDQDPGFKPVRTVTAFGHRLTAYQVKPGTSAPPAIVVREQTPIVPGVCWVRRVGGIEDASTVDIEPLGGGLVRFSYPPMPGRDAVVDAVVRLPGMPDP